MSERSEDVARQGPLPGPLDADPFEDQERSIRATIRDIGETLDAIRERLTPGHLREAASLRIREATVGRAQRVATGARHTFEQGRAAIGSAMGTAAANVRGAFVAAGQRIRFRIWRTRQRLERQIERAGASTARVVRENPTAVGALVGLLTAVGFTLLAVRLEQTRRDSFR